jgi:hypothetical protein
VFIKVLPTNIKVVTVIRVAASQLMVTTIIKAPQQEERAITLVQKVPLAIIALKLNH